MKLKLCKNNEKWTIDKLMSMCVQEKTRKLMKEKNTPKQAHMVESSNKGGGKKHTKRRETLKPCDQRGFLCLCGMCSKLLMWPHHEENTK